MKEELQELFDCHICRINVRNPANTAFTKNLSQQLGSTTGYMYCNIYSSFAICTEKGYYKALCGNKVVTARSLVALKVKMDLLYIK